MDMTDLIMSIITLVLILLFMFNPLFRKFMKALQGEKGDMDSGEDRMYESVDSRRVLKNLMESGNPIETMEIPDGKKMVFHDSGLRPAAQSPGSKAVKKDSLLKSNGPEDLKRAVLWKEILGPPRSLNPFGEDEFF